MHLPSPLHGFHIYRAVRVRHTTYLFFDKASRGLGQGVASLLLCSREVHPKLLLGARPDLRTTLKRSHQGAAPRARHPTPRAARALLPSRPQTLRARTNSSLCVPGLLRAGLSRLDTRYPAHRQTRAARGRLISLPGAPPQASLPPHHGWRCASCSSWPPSQHPPRPSWRPCARVLRTFPVHSRAGP